MSRFSHLEFGDESESEQPVQWVPKGGAHYLAEAGSAFETGRFEQALRCYGRVLEYDPRSVAAWFGQVQMLIELDELREARLWADTALEKVPDASELLAAKAVALGRLGDVKAALPFSDAAVEARGDAPYVWFSRGDVLLAAKEKRAEYCFEKAVAFEPGNWMMHWWISRACLYHRQFSRALRSARQAIEVDASRAVGWIQLGQCQTALGLLGPAAVSEEQARQLDAECPLHVRGGPGSGGGIRTRLLGAVRRLFQR